MKETTIGELCSEEKENAQIFNFNSINYLETGDIIENKIISYSHLIVNVDKIPSRARKKAKKEEILFSLVRPNQKHYGIVDENWPEDLVVSTGFAVIKANLDIDPYYLYYLLTNEVNTNLLQSIAEQSVTSYPSITFNDIANVKVKIFQKLEIQKNISHLLKSIDKKIEINNRINDNLSQLAFDTFLYFFASKKANGIIGDLIIEACKSKTQVNDVKGKEGQYPFLTSGEAILRSNNYLVDNRNIFLTTGGNSNVKFYVGKADYSTDTWCIRANHEMTDYLFLFFRFISPVMDMRFFQGTGLKHLQKDLLKNEPIYIPSENELSRFNSLVKPLYDEISKNSRENYNLSLLKNDLLPLLINGQITIR